QPRPSRPTRLVTFERVGNLDVLQSGPDRAPSKDGVETVAEVAQPAALGVAEQCVRRAAVARRRATRVEAEQPWVPEHHDPRVGKLLFQLVVERAEFRVDL